MTHQTAIVTYTGTTEHRAARWSDASPDERKRRALEAASSRDTAELWSLTETHLYLTGASGAHVSPHTLTSYRAGVRLYVTWCGSAGVTIARASADQGRAFVRWLEGRFASASVRARLAAARQLYAALRWSGATTAAPFADCKPARDLTAAHEKRAPFSPEELGGVLAVADPLERAFLLAGAHAGCRISEALELRWSDINGHTLRVRSGKGRKARTVELSASLTAALAAIRPSSPGDERVFPFRQHAGRQRLAKLCRRAGVEQRCYHALRHHAGVLVYRATGDLNEVAEHLGHSSVETARVYVHHTHARLRELFASL